jgi:HD superfamily phosphohydrolase YqeK
MQYDSFLIKDFSFYEENVLPIILAEPTVLQKRLGYHGLLTHTKSVVFRGIDYCLSLSQDVMPVILACAFHDLAKGYDGYDEEHGINAVPIAQKIIPKLDLDLSNEQIDMIFDAIKDHTTGMNAQNYVSGCLWDADRTRLSWSRGFDERFYYSARAKQVASGSAYDYVRYMCECIGIPFTDELLRL